VVLKPPHPCPSPVRRGRKIVATPIGRRKKYRCPLLEERENIVVTLSSKDGGENSRNFF